MVKRILLLPGINDDLDVVTKRLRAVDGSFSSEIYLLTLSLTIF